MVEKITEADARAARRDYFREWRRKNPDKVRAINERYWMKKAVELASQKEGVES